MIENPLAFLDCETTGLSASSGHRVIELSIILTSPWPEMKVLGEFTTKIKPTEQDLKLASPKALEVNGYAAHPELWDNAPSSTREVWERAAQLLRGAVLVCQNVAFDSGFVEAEMARHPGILGPRGGIPWQRRHVETYTFAHMIAQKLDVRDGNGRIVWGLAQVYKAMGGPELPEHNARPDVLRCMYLYKSFWGAYEQGLRTTKLAEETEQARVQLAGCGVAAKGGVSEALSVDVSEYGWSVAYEDVRALRLAAEDMAARLGVPITDELAKHHRTNAEELRRQAQFIRDLKTQDQIDNPTPIEGC
jgi:hypothetical protein